MGAARDSLGFDPWLRIDGDLAALSVELEGDLVAVVREALANVSRHARAAHVEVSVVATDVLRVVVADDGAGTDPESVESGLANLRARAGNHGGALRLEPNLPHGTVLTWTAEVTGSATS